MKDFLILVPTKTEAGPLASGLEFKLKNGGIFSTYEGVIGQLTGTIIVAGYSKKFRQNLPAIFVCFPSAKIILAGTAGGLKPDLKIGQVFLIKEVINQENGQTLKIEISEKWQNLPPAAALTGAALAELKLKKEFQKTWPAAQLYDQESFYFAEKCLADKKDFLILRVVSDELKTLLPPMELIRKHFEKINLRFFLGDFLKNPAGFWRLLKLRRNFKKGMKKLALVLKELLNI